MQKVYLDTNVLLDFLGEREGFYLPMARLLTLADEKKIEVFASAKSIATTYYILSKYESAKAALEKIRKFKMLCKLSIIDDEVMERAINAGFPDFEDAIQYCSAVATGCDTIITRHEKDFKKASVKVMDAEKFLKFFEG
jgi:predicted nucleic acid-binding protein